MMKPLSSKPIKLLACDIDGCLVPIRHARYALERVAELAALNASSAHDAAIPRLTFVTGRPHAYVDALMQVLDISVPAVFENGAGIAYRSPYAATFHDGLEGRLGELDRLRSLLAGRSDITLQLGKVASLSVFPNPQEGSIAPLLHELHALLVGHSMDLHLDPSHECVNVLIPGIDKGTGFRWLLREMSVDGSEVAGIGDSVGDLVWLQECAVSCAPCNADPKLEERVTLPSKQSDVEATIEFYSLLVASNRMLLEAAPTG